MNKAQKNFVIFAMCVAFVYMLNHCISDRKEDVNSSDQSDNVPGYLTTSQKNAFKEAKDYLRSNSFSKQGLIDQLDSSAVGFSTEDATKAVNILNVDWKEQAIKKANSYLKIRGFSCQGLLSQLTSSAGEKFSLDEALYAVEKVNVCPSNMTSNLVKLEDAIDINSGDKDKFHKFVDAGGLKSYNDNFHGFHVNNVSVEYNKEGKINSVEILSDSSYSLNDVFSGMGDYCKIDKWNRITDNYSENLFTGNGFGKNCDAMYEKSSDGLRLTYTVPGALQH